MCYLTLTSNLTLPKLTSLHLFLFHFLLFFTFTFYYHFSYVLYPFHATNQICLIPYMQDLTLTLTLSQDLMHTILLYSSSSLLFDLNIRISYLNEPMQFIFI